MGEFETFAVGQRAWSFAQDGQGNMTVEGECVVLMIVDAVAGKYLVQFGTGEPDERFLQKEGQHDPHGFVQWVNDPSTDGDHHGF